MIEFTNEELEQIAYGLIGNSQWTIVTREFVQERRWGYDERVIFTHINGQHPFYGFVHYVGSGDSEIDFEPEKVGLYKPTQITITKWEFLEDA